MPFESDVRNLRLMVEGQTNLKAFDKLGTTVRAMGKDVSGLADEYEKSGQRITVAFDRTQKQLQASNDRSQKAMLAAVEDSRKKMSAVDERYQKQMTALQDQQAKQRIRLDQVEMSGRVMARKSLLLEMEQTERKMTEAQAAASRDRLRLAADEAARQTAITAEQSKAQTAILTEQARIRATAQAQATNHLLTTGGAIATGAYNAVGTGVLGGGAVLGLGGYALARSAAKNQQFVFQQGANSFLTGSQLTQMVAFSKSMALQSGIPWQQILTAARYGSDMQLLNPRVGGSMGLLQGTVTASNMLAAPTGANIQDVIQAIGTGQVQFPAYRNNPLAVGNMILSGARLGRSTPADFVGQIAPVLAIAGQYGPSQLPQALAAVASLTAGGVPLDEAVTQVKNLYQQIALGDYKKPRADLLNSLDKQYGLNLFQDFSPMGLQSKGLLGVMNDLNQAQLGQHAYQVLFPNQRGIVGAINLAGTHNGLFNVGASQITNAATATGPQSIQGLYKGYLGLDSTQQAKINEQLKQTALILGNSLLPAFNKDMQALEPVIKGFSDWTVQNQKMIDGAIELAPKLLLVGAGMKVIGAGVRGINVVMDAAEGAMAAYGAALGTEGIAGAATAASTELAKVAPAVKDAEVAAAIGSKGNLAVTEEAAITGSAGSGLLGIAESIAIIGAAALVAIPLVTAIEGIRSEKGGPAGYRGTTKVTGGIRAGVYVPPDKAGAVYIPQGGNLPIIPGQKVQLEQPPGGQPWQDVRAPSTSFGIPTSGSRFDFGPLSYPTYVGVKNATAHWDYHTRMGTPVTLPGGSNAGWQLTDAFFSTKWGWELDFTTPIGGVMQMLHMHDVSGLGSDVGSLWPPNSAIVSAARKYIGHWYKGGATIAHVGVADDPTYGATPHLHVALDATAEKYLYSVTNGQNWQTASPPGGSYYQVGQTGQPVGTPVAAGGSASSPAGGGTAGNPTRLPGTMSQYWGGSNGYAAVGQRDKINPYVLAGIGQAESSGHPEANSGMGVTDLSGGVGINAAGGSLRNDINWSYSPAGEASMRAHADVLKRYGYTNLNASDTHQFVGLAVYNRGPFDWWDDRALDDKGRPFNGVRGPAYAKRVLGFSTQFQQQNTPSSGIGTRGNNYNATTTTPPPTWAQRASSLQGVITSEFGASYLAKPTGKNYGMAKSQIDTYLWLEAHAQIKAITDDPTLSTAEKNAAVKLVWQNYNKDLKHPFMAFTGASKSKGQPSTPADWASYYGGIVSTDTSALDAIMGGKDISQIHDPTVRAAIAQVVKNRADYTYQQQKSEINATPGMSPAAKQAAIRKIGRDQNWIKAHPFASLSTSSSAHGALGTINAGEFTDRCSTYNEQKKTNRHLAQHGKHLATIATAATMIAQHHNGRGNYGKPTPPKRAGVKAVHPQPS